MGAEKSGPHINSEEELIQSIHNAPISFWFRQKLKIIQYAVAKCPRVSISAHGIQIPSLLDSSSGVMLLQQSYFEQVILPIFKSVPGEKADAHVI